MHDSGVQTLACCRHAWQNAQHALKVLLQLSNTDFVIFLPKFHTFKTPNTFGK
ncbi:uncharacterized protein G2W53_014675 [Senna tora]|uniref:Uncharacterized protein n=1 Tax=Senna tora TaxID=362788 RepID=A0A834WU04_9FABA|nr:uncharacterized protein G2W53_014675 [Senna tora]